MTDQSNPSHDPYAQNPQPVAPYNPYAAPAQPPVPQYGQQYGQPMPGQAPYGVAGSPYAQYAHLGATGAAAAPTSTLYQVAAIINWVVLGLLVVGTCGLGIIAAAWYIPMTIAIHKGAKDRVQHTALAVCTLLFCNIVSGILMLCDQGNRSERPTY
ncbi:hypothetical protein [Nocardioides yefusunii]|uniref:DUF4190 domain-containing protein n=1 Tax=Nocardioides yefusunii TaxID=2500546 RepID=A0ABW1QZW8_9ACTN|nr:hypothetical protein [Nocardioides yefusunii]